MNFIDTTTTVIGPFWVTGYSWTLLLGAVLGILATLLLGRKRPGVSALLTACIITIPCAWAGARIVYVLTQLETIFVDAEYYGVPFLVQPWQGGYTLYGAVLGGLLGAWLSAKAVKMPVGEVADALAPGAALVLCFTRLGEYFTQQGLGHMVENEALQCFPFAVYNVGWDAWQIPVFFYEALAALAIFIVTARMTGKCHRAGRSTDLFLGILSVTQVLLESLRDDECIRFGFVRFTQIMAAVTLFVLLVVNVVRHVRESGDKRGVAARFVIYVLCVGACIAVEFGLDKSTIDNRLLYVVMAAALVLLGVVVMSAMSHDLKAEKKPRPRIKRVSI